MKITALFLAFYLSIGSLIPRSDFSQLTRMADLQAHYVEHQAEAAAKGLSISFVDFLYIHFVDSEEHEEEHHQEDHHQLPLQKIGSFTGFILEKILPVPVLKNTGLSPLKNLSYQSPFYLSGFCTLALQPPSR